MADHPLLRTRVGASIGGESGMEIVPAASYGEKRRSNSSGGSTRHHADGPEDAVMASVEAIQAIRAPSFPGDSLPNYGQRRREGKPVSKAWVESEVDEIITKHKVKKQQMQCNRWTVQPFLALRTSALTDSFRVWPPHSGRSIRKLQELVAA